VNWLQEAERGYPKWVVQILAEGWAWLHQNGLVAAGQHTMYTPGLMFVTRLGRHAAEGGLGTVRAFQRLNMDLHPEIRDKVRPQYVMGEFELAAFAAMRTVEVRVRRLVGVPAFGAGGPLWDDHADAGEMTARMELFAGAIGLFKNPVSHREVLYDDPIEASEIIMFADLLLRILDRIEAAHKQ
jgi:uncharacterized protein (TIGR02391 family)